MNKLLSLPKTKVEAFLVEYFLNNPPKTDDELYLCIESLFGYSIPRISVCPSHSAPMEFLADTFFERYPSILVMANRTGGKTLDVALLNVLEAIYKDGCGIASLAGSKDQANKQYKYSQEFFSNNRSLWDKFVIERKFLQSYTEFKNKSYFKILATSHTSVRSPHLPKLRIDEVDEIDNRDIFSAALSIPLSDQYRGIKANVLMTSTRHKPYGLMKELVDSVNESGRRLVQFCYKEVAQRCPDYLSGDAPTKYYINSGDRKILTPKKFLGLLDSEKSKYNRYQMFNKCIKCPLAPSCRGDLKRSDGYYLIDDLINKYTDPLYPTDKWESEWECRLPYMGNLVYSGFDPNTHVKTIEYDKNLRTYCGIDFGWTNFYCVWFQIGLNNEILIFDEYSEPRTATGHRAEIMRSKPYYNVQYWGDPSGSTQIVDEVSGLSYIEKFAKNGVNIKYRRVAPERRRNFLRDKMIVHDDRTEFYVDKNKAPIFYRAVMSYHLKKTKDGMITDDPVRDESSHPCVVGSTAIRTLHGWIPIRDLVGKDNFYTYSYSNIHRRLIPIKVGKVRKTGNNVEVWKLVHDGGELIATPDHLIMLRDGTYKKLCELSPHDSLMPLYSHPDRGSVRLVLNDGSIARENVYVYRFFNNDVDDGLIIHHIDGDPFNNEPHNLVQLDKRTHASIHHKGKKLSDEQKAAISVNSKLHSDKARERIIKINKSRAGDKHHTKDTLYFTDKLRKKMSLSGKQFWKSTERLKICPNCKNSFIGNWKKVYCCQNCQASVYRDKNREKLRNLHYYHNHRVVKVKFYGYEDVYDMAVPEYHNYPAEGIIVHNCDGVEYAVIGAFSVGKPKYY